MPAQPSLQRIASRPFPAPLAQRPGGRAWGRLNVTVPAHRHAAGQRIAINIRPRHGRQVVVRRVGARVRRTVTVRGRAVARVTTAVVRGADCGRVGSDVTRRAIARRRVAIRAVVVAAGSERTGQRQAAGEPRKSFHQGGGGGLGLLTGWECSRRKTTQRRAHSPWGLQPNLPAPFLRGSCLRLS